MAMPFMLGAIGFCQRKGWIPRVARWLTRSKWSCVFVIYRCEPGCVMVLEGGPSKVRSVSITRYESKDYVSAFFFPTGVCGAEISRGLYQLKDRVVARRNWFERTVTLPLAIVSRLLGIRLSNRRKGGIISSDLVLQYLGWLEPETRWEVLDKEAVTPEDLFGELAAHPKFKLERA